MDRIRSTCLSGPGLMTIVMLAMSLHGLAQSTGKLLLLIDPGHNFEFVVDGQQRLQQREITLSAGDHTFSFWAPGYRIVDTTILVVPDRSTQVVLRLPVSKEYVTYQKEMNAWRSSRKLSRALPTVVTGASLIWAGLSYGKYRKAHDQLQEDLDEYNSNVAPGLINVLKDTDIPEHQDAFENAEKQFQLAAGIAIVSAGVTTYLYIRSAKKPVPVFEDKEKVRFDGLVWLPGDNGGMWMTGLTLNLFQGP